MQGPTALPGGSPVAPQWPPVAPQWPTTRHQELQAPSAHGSELRPHERVVRGPAGCTWDFWKAPKPHRADYRVPLLGMRADILRNRISLVHVNVNVHNLLAISESVFDNSGEPGPQAEGVNHLVDETQI